MNPSIRCRRGISIGAAPVSFPGQEFSRRVLAGLVATGRRETVCGEVLLGGHLGYRENPRISGRSEVAREGTSRRPIRWFGRLHVGSRGESSGLLADLSVETECRIPHLADWSLLITVLGSRPQHGFVSQFRKRDECDPTETRTTRFSNGELPMLSPAEIHPRQSFSRFGVAAERGDRQSTITGWHRCRAPEHAAGEGQFDLRRQRGPRIASGKECPHDMSSTARLNRSRRHQLLSLRQPTAHS